MIRDQGGTKSRLDLVSVVSDVAASPKKECDYDLVAPIQVS